MTTAAVSSGFSAPLPSGRRQRAAEPAALLFPAEQLPPSQTKRCAACRQHMPLASFPPHNAARDGRRRHCRACLLAGRHQPRIETPEQRERRNVRQSREEWRQSHREALARHAERNPLKAAAVRAVQRALRSGRVQRAEQCQAKGCTSQHRLEAHHWSYEREHWRDVLWCCAKCHRQGHARGFIVPADGIDRKYGTIPDLDTEEVERAA